jgi:hypothetical protein
MTQAQLRKIFIGLIASIAVLSVIFGIFGNRYLAPAPGEGNTPHAPGALGGVPVPEADSEVPSNVAKPTEALPAGAATEAKRRVFDIEVNEDAFSKNTIIVNQWDIARVNFFAVDKAYDFYWPDFGLRQSAKKGETKSVEFQATRSGTFQFYCERCGGPAKGPVGTLRVVPSE